MYAVSYSYEIDVNRRTPDDIEFYSSYETFEGAWASIMVMREEVRGDFYWWIDEVSPIENFERTIASGMISG